MVQLEKISAAVLGASGYTGGELVRLLASHPGVDLTYLGVRDAQTRTLEGEHAFLGPLSIPLSELDPAAAAAAADFVFLAMPHKLSADLVPDLLDAGSRVIDLGGDFRLEEDDYPEWYDFQHPAPGLLPEAVYGLTELFRDRIKEARLVANPGCYPTAVTLGLAPLVDAGLIGSPIMVDGKSGISGAGKSLRDASMFSTTAESVRPYKVPKHQHTPEMERGIELATGIRPAIVFAPHLVPMVRGMVCTCFAPAAVDGLTSEALVACLTDAYAGSAFVRVLPVGGMVDSKRTRGSNVIELQALHDSRTDVVTVIGAQDNLVKGAAGQAIQNLNLMAGFDEALGLSAIAVYP